MAALGKKHLCFQCGTRFYDMGKAVALCPKCGADQRNAPKADKTAKASKRPTYDTDDEAPPARDEEREEGEESLDEMMEEEQDDTEEMDDAGDHPADVDD